VSEIPANVLHANETKPPTTINDLVAKHMVTSLQLNSSRIRAHRPSVVPPQGSTFSDAGVLGSPDARAERRSARQLVDRHGARSGFDAIPRFQKTKSALAKSSRPRAGFGVLTSKRSLRISALPRRERAG
jgi:hypothetical protein